jgi:hypothetical protein
MADDHIIEWYLPDRGPNSVESLVSHMDGTRSAVFGAAMGMGRDASANLSAHYRKGNAFIEVEGAPPRKLDSYVYLRDADPGGEGKGGRNTTDRSAMSIEFGWTTKTGKDIKGLHILGNAMNKAASRYRGRS